MTAAMWAARHGRVLCLLELAKLGAHLAVADHVRKLELLVNVPLPNTTALIVCHSMTRTGWYDASDACGRVWPRRRRGRDRASSCAFPKDEQGAHGGANILRHPVERHGDSRDIAVWSDGTRYCEAAWFCSHY